MFNNHEDATTTTTATEIETRAKNFVNASGYGFRWV